MRAEYKSKTDEIKKTRKLLSFNNFKASSPMISPNEIDLPAAPGGVCGKNKLRTPKMAEAPEANKNVLANKF